MMADEVRQIEFHQRVRGYRVEDVDNFLAKLVIELEAGRPIGELCVSAKLRQNLRGYDIEEVDRFLAQAGG
jgi:DivIVA domain-containing protein